MSPSEYRKHIANTIAILQGHESVSSLGMNKAIYEDLYETAKELQKTHHVAVKVRNHYVVVHHVPTWTKISR